MTSAIIVAAGSSRRMGFNKLLAPLAGVPVLRRTLEAFQACTAIDEIIVVAGDEVRAAIASWQSDSALDKLRHVVAGGAERHLSVWQGIQSCAKNSQVIAVHDGARPLISCRQIIRCVEAARDRQAVACARLLTETIKRADAAGRIIESIDRTGVWIMETPQVFMRPLLAAAYEAVLRDAIPVTDEVSAVQHIGQPVFVVENADPNPKITFPSDLILAERFVG